MIVKFLGLNKINFISRDGNPVKGTKIYVSLPLTAKDETWEGARVDTIWVGEDSGLKIPTMKCGEDYNFVFEGFGKRQYLVEISPVKL